MIFLAQKHNSRITFINIFITSTFSFHENENSQATLLLKLSSEYFKKHFMKDMNTTRDF